MSDQDERGRTTTDTGESEARFSAETDADVDMRPNDSLWSQVTDEWHLWTATAAALLVAVYFHLTEGLVGTTAEKFYAIIFLMVAVVVFGYGLRQVEDRRVPL